MEGSRDGAKAARPLLVAALHLSALWGLAVVQPTLELLSDGDSAAIFFAGRRVIGGAFVAVVVATVVLPLVALVGLEALVGRLLGERRRERLHLVLVWGLAALLVLYVLERAWRSTAASENGAIAMIVGAAALGLALTALYRRWQPLRSVLSVLSPFPLIAMALFVFASPASELVFSSGESDPLAAPASGTPVVMVIFDELPTSTLMDERELIDARRYPGFAELARQATWYRNDVSAADDTVQALPAILASARPGRGDAPVHSARPRSIFKLLGRTHRVRAMEHATWLCPPETCPEARSALRRASGVASALGLAYFDTIVPPGLFTRIGVGMPDIGRTWGEALRSEDPTRSLDELIRLTGNQPRELNRYADAQFARFLRLIEPYRPGQRRAPFYLLHSALPHLPWVFLPGGKVYAGIRDRLPGRNEGGAFEQWTEDAPTVWLGWQRHILQTRFADHELGRLIAKLRHSGLYDRALVVVTADHGASFVPGENRRFVTKANAADVAMVPLFVKAPGQRRPVVVDRAVQSVDLMPTVADLLGRRIPWPIEGRSVLSPGAGRRSVSISSFKSATLTTDPAKLTRQRSATVRRQAALFGTGLEGGAGFGIGPARLLVGRHLSDLPMTRPSGARARLDDAGAFAAVDVRSRYLPAARASGRIEGGYRPVRTVAAAVNGRVAGVGPTVRAGGRTFFALMLRPDTLRQGRNDLRLYAVRGSTRRTVLEPL
jgi:hypothetical protein